ncbi:MAG: hypothetical protein JWM09_762 [Francisellaceae bacterium]|nr:hypothetical protein [Francisellaceae bacterium]
MPNPPNKDDNSPLERIFLKTQQKGKILENTVTDNNTNENTGLKRRLSSVIEDLKKNTSPNHKQTSQPEVYNAYSKKQNKFSSSDNKKEEIEGPNIGNYANGFKKTIKDTLTSFIKNNENRKGGLNAKTLMSKLEKIGYHDEKEIQVAIREEIIKLDKHHKSSFGNKSSNNLLIKTLSDLSFKLGKMIEKDHQEHSTQIHSERSRSASNSASSINSSTNRPKS